MCYSKVASSSLVRVKRDVFFSLSSSLFVSWEDRTRAFAQSDMYPPFTLTRYSSYNTM